MLYVRTLLRCAHSECAARFLYATARQRIWIT